MRYPRWRIGAFILLALGLVVFLLKPEQNGVFSAVQAPLWFISILIAFLLLLLPAPPRDLLFVANLILRKHSITVEIDRLTEAHRALPPRSWLKWGTLILVVLAPCAYLYSSAVRVEARLIDMLMRQNVRTLVDACNLHYPKGLEVLTTGNVVGLAKLRNGPIGWALWMRGLRDADYRRGRRGLDAATEACEELYLAYGGSGSGDASPPGIDKLRPTYGRIAFKPGLDSLVQALSGIEMSATTRRDIGAALLLGGRLAWSATSAPEDTLDNMRERAIMLATRAKQADPSLAGPYSILGSAHTIELARQNLRPSDFVALFAKACEQYESANSRVDNPAAVARMKNNIANLKLRAVIELQRRTRVFRDSVQAIAKGQSVASVDVLAKQDISILAAGFVELRSSIGADPYDRVYLLTRAQIYSQMALALERSRAAKTLAPVEVESARSVLGGRTKADRQYVIDELLNRAKDDLADAQRRGADLGARIGDSKTRDRSGFAILNYPRYADVLNAIESRTDQGQ